MIKVGKCTFQVANVKNNGFRALTIGFQMHGSWKQVFLGAWNRYLWFNVSFSDIKEITDFRIM